MKQLELKHLAPYLPYGLTALSVVKGSFIPDPDIKQVVKIGLNNVESCYTKRYRQISCKPILRPLSDLSKEIEHNGKKFRPFHELDHDFELQNDKYLCLVLHGARIIDLFKHPYEVMQKLFEWHFDVFGLIDSGLAIDINTLEI